MTAIHAALAKLNQSLQTLEESAAAREAAAKATTRQRRSAQEDLFTAQVAANVSARDNMMVAKRIDGAIDTLEKLLAQG